MYVMCTYFYNFCVTSYVNLCSGSCVYAFLYKNSELFSISFLVELSRILFSIFIFKRDCIVLFLACIFDCYLSEFIIQHINNILVPILVLDFLSVFLFYFFLTNPLLLSIMSGLFAWLIILF